MKRTVVNAAILMIAGCLGFPSAASAQSAPPASRAPSPALHFLRCAAPSEVVEIDLVNACLIRNGFSPPTSVRGFSSCLQNSIASGRYITPCFARYQVAAIEAPGSSRGRTNTLLALGAATLVGGLLTHHKQGPTPTPTPTDAPTLTPTPVPTRIQPPEPTPTASSRTPATSQPAAMAPYPTTSPLPLPSASELPSASPSPSVSASLSPSPTATRKAVPIVPKPATHKQPPPSPPNTLLVTRSTVYVDTGIGLFAGLLLGAALQRAGERRRSKRNHSHSRTIVALRARRP